MSQTQKTTNKSNRELGNKFDLGQFNSKFDENEKKIESEKKLMGSQDMKKSDEALSSKLPHKRPVEDVIINMRDIFIYNIE